MFTNRHTENWAYLFLEVSDLSTGLIPQFKRDVHDHLYALVNQVMQCGEGFRHPLQTQTKGPQSWGLRLEHRVRWWSRSRPLDIPVTADLCVVMDESTWDSQRPFEMHLGQMNSPVQKLCFTPNRLQMWTNFNTCTFYSNSPERTKHMELDTLPDVHARNHKGAVFIDLCSHTATDKLFTHNAPYENKSAECTRTQTWSHAGTRGRPDTPCTHNSDCCGHVQPVRQALLFTLPSNMDTTHLADDSIGMQQNNRAVFQSPTPGGPILLWKFIYELMKQLFSVCLPLSVKCMETWSQW